MPSEDDTTVPTPDPAPESTPGPVPDPAQDALPPTVAAPVDSETIGMPTGDLLRRAQPRRNAPLPNIPGYAVERIIGEGGMGAVYQAAQAKPARRVALKLIRPGAVTPRSLRRFEHEAEVLGRLQHPGIAAIHEAGLHEGTPFFAMEFIDGPTLTDYANAHKLGTRDRLALFAQVCDAVHHAHAKGVIHRDLKPGNILVTRIGDPPAPQAKVLDFGIARVTESDIHTTTMHTDVGQVVGTIPYMSPEQVAGENDDIDTRSDVYALGVVLYELLAGQLPYDLKNRLIHEAARVIREDEPTRLSGVNTRFRGDIETIVGKAMEKERDRRYQSANDLGSDIRRFLGDEPIQARPPSRSYQVKKFAQRHKGLVSGVAATFLVLNAGIVATSVFAVRADAARQDAEQARLDEKDQRELAQQNERAERERAEELELVVKFQEDQLASIDTEMMGIKLRQSLLDEARSAAERAGWEEPDIEERLASLDEALAGANFTDIALRSMDENIFQRALAVINQQFSDRPVLQARLLQTIGRICYKLGLLETARSPLLTSLSIVKQVQPENQRTILNMESNLASFYATLGDFELSEELYLSVNDGYSALLGDNHVDLLTAMNTRAILLASLGRYDEAEPMLIDVIARCDRTLRDRHPLTLSASNSLGILLKETGRLEEAEELLRNVLEDRRHLFGNEDSSTLMSINNLGFVLIARGKFDDAEVLLLEALATRRDRLGNSHPDTLMSVANIGVMFGSTGRITKAEQFQNEAIAGRRRVLGSTHPETLQSIGNMGTLHEIQGRHNEAETLYQEALDGYMQRFGENHPATQLAIYNLWKSIRIQNRPEEAEVYFRRLADGYRQSTNKNNPDVLRVAHAIAVCLMDEGQLAEAEQIFHDTLSARSSVLGELHLDTLSTAHSLSTLYKRQRRFSESETLFRTVLDGLHSYRDSNLPLLHHCLSGMGSLLQQMGRYEEAITYHQESYEIRSRLLAADDALTLDSLDSLAVCCVYTDQLERAENYTRECLALRRAAFGDNDLDTLETMCNLAEVLGRRGKFEESIPLAQESLTRRIDVLGNDNPPTARSHWALSNGLLGSRNLVDAEKALLDCYHCHLTVFGDDHAGTIGSVELLIYLYETWHAAEPGAGHDEQAEHWRGVLVEAHGEE